MFASVVTPRVVASVWPTAAAAVPDVPAEAAVGELGWLISTKLAASMSSISPPS